LRKATLKTHSKEQHLTSRSCTDSLADRSSEGNEVAWPVWDQLDATGLSKRRKLDLTTPGHKIGRGLPTPESNGVLS